MDIAYMLRRIWVVLVVLSAEIPLVQAAMTAHLQSFVDSAMMGRVRGVQGGQARRRGGKRRFHLVRGRD